MRKFHFRFRHRLRFRYRYRLRFRYRYRLRYRFRHRPRQFTPSSPLTPSSTKVLLSATKKKKGFHTPVKTLVKPASVHANCGYIFKSTAKIRLSPRITKSFPYFFLPPSPEIPFRVSLSSSPSLSLSFSPIHPIHPIKPINPINLILPINPPLPRTSAHPHTHPPLHRSYTVQEDVWSYTQLPTHHRRELASCR